MRQGCRVVDFFRGVGTDFAATVPQSWFATKATASTASRDREVQQTSIFERRRTRRSSKRQLREWAQDMNLEGSVFIHSARPVHGKDPGKGSVGRNCKGEPKRQEDNDFWKYLFRLSTYKGRSTVHRAWNSWATADKEKTSAGDRSYSWSGFEAYDYEGFYFQDRRQRKRGFGENENQHTYYKQKVRLPQGIRENLLLLDLDPTCLPTVVQAKEAFMKFAMHNHPDRYADDPIKVRCAEENFKKVNAAYHSLLSQISTFTTKSP